MARCGKDTFATFLNEFVPTLKYSSIDRVKEIAKLCGWNGGKTERDRKFLSDLKMLTSAYSDMPLNAITSKVVDLMEKGIIDISEEELAESMFNDISLLNELFAQ